MGQSAFVANCTAWMHFTLALTEEKKVYAFQQSQWDPPEAAAWSISTHILLLSVWLRC